MTMKTILASAAIALVATTGAPALAKHHEKESAKSSTNLRSVITHERRAKDKARDKYRNPVKTLMFFDVQPHHTVVEYAPGGGWYTRVLAPLVAEDGKYIAVNFAPEDTPIQRVADRLKGFPEYAPGRIAEWTGSPADRFSAYFGNAVPEELHGTVDRIIVPRMMHNLKRWNVADGEITTWRNMLKDDGMVGIVQHWAPETHPYSASDGNAGYLKKSDVVALMRLYGFELAKESDINANPKDKANHERGVWTLPPTYATGDKDRERYTEIGESNRMTLLFKKAK